jgi:hypothetical protein
VFRSQNEALVAGERGPAHGFSRHPRRYGRYCNLEGGKVLATLGVMGIVAVGSLVMSASASAAAQARIGEFVGQRNLSVTAHVYSHVLSDETELEYANLLA